MDLSWIYRPAQALQIGNFWEVTGRQQAGPYLSGLVCWPHYSFQHLQNCGLTNKSARWVCTYINSAARRDCEAASQRNCLKTQEHLATSTVMPVVRFTCCQHLPKLPTDSLLQDRSSCQFGELFRKHKLVFTGPVWIAGHVAPLNKCRIANSSKLQ